MSDKVEEHQNRICDQIEKYQGFCHIFVNCLHYWRISLYIEGVHYHVTAYAEYDMHVFDSKFNVFYFELYSSSNFEPSQNFSAKKWAISEFWSIFRAEINEYLNGLNFWPSQNQMHMSSRDTSMWSRELLWCLFDLSGIAITLIWCQKFEKWRNYFPKIDTFEALNEKTTTERESLTSQLSESNQVRSELQLHITQLEQQYKEVSLSDFWIAWITLDIGNGFATLLHTLYIFRAQIKNWSKIRSTFVWRSICI